MFVGHSGLSSLLLHSGSIFHHAVHEGVLLVVDEEGGGVAHKPATDLASLDFPAQPEFRALADFFSRPVLHEKIEGRRRGARRADSLIELDRLVVFKVATAVFSLDLCDALSAEVARCVRAAVMRGR